MAGLRYDIIGCGAVVQRMHAPIVRSLHAAGRVSIRACVDVNADQAERAARLLGAESACGPEPPRDMRDVDAVLIATPMDTHAGLARRYIESGKHVFVEKPFTPEACQAEELASAARDNGVYLAVNHFKRFFPSVVTARRFVAAGGLGRIQRVEARDGSRWWWPTSSEYPVRNQYGGVLYDVGSHALDMVLYMLALDEPEARATFAVEHVESKPPSEPSHNCYARLHLQPAGAPAMPLEVFLSRSRSFANVVTLHGERGTLTVPIQFAHTPTLRLDSDDFFVSLPIVTARPTDQPGCLLMAHEEFVSAAQGSRQSESNRLEASRFVLLTAIIDAIARHGRTG